MRPAAVALALLLLAPLASAAVWLPRDTGSSATLRGVAAGTSVLAAGDGLTVVQSLDAGITWRQVYGGFGGAWHDVAWRSTTEAMAAGVGELGYAFVGSSSDGGRTWSSRLLFLGDTGEAVLRGVAFSGSAVLVAGSFPDGTGVVVRSPDGDESWPPTLLSPEALVAIDSGDDTALAVGARGAAYHSRDGGATWARGVGAGTVDLAGVALADARVGVAVGKAGTILRTTDGGATWARVSSIAAVDLHAVAFATPRVGFAVGDAGTVLGTRDGGATWAPDLSLTDARLLAVDAAATSVLVRAAFAGERGVAAGGLDAAPQG